MQDTIDIDGIGLERNVKYAIKYDLPIIFGSKEKEECEYMQKVADVQLSKLDVLLAGVLFTFAGGGGFVLASHHLAWLILFIIGCFLLCIWYRRSVRCCQVILGLEKRIQSENFKKRKAENVESTQ